MANILLHADELINQTLNVAAATRMIAKRE
jgi:hypothetical protein